MKYIRTEIGIYERVEQRIYKAVYYPLKYGMYRKDYKSDFELIINQADTIEELCDCFVTDGNRHIVWDKQQNKGITFEQVKESFTAYHFKIYGAIWTDKGLIYVAKMNKDGELELI